MWFYDFGSGSGWDYLNQKNKESSTSTTQPVYSSCSRAMVHWQFILLLLMLFSSATFFKLYMRYEYKHHSYF